jgi:peptidyl-prolyl cis-trans isomerase A (cyclophilin A)
LGADRFYELVKSGFYDGARFFRVLPGFMAQFGIAADPQVNAKWKDSNIQDDPVKQSNAAGMLTFAKTGAPNSRTTQMFINTGNNARLDADGFAPIGQVITGLDVVQSFYNGYGEGAPDGRGPSQDQIKAEGNAYLEKGFPQLDFIKKATAQ